MLTPIQTWATENNKSRNKNNKWKRVLRDDANPSTTAARLAGNARRTNRSVSPQRYHASNRYNPPVVATRDRHNQTYGDHNNIEKRSWRREQPLTRQRNAHTSYHKHKTELPRRHYSSSSGNHQRNFDNYNNQKIMLPRYHQSYAATKRQQNFHNYDENQEKYCKWKRVPSKIDKAFSEACKHGDVQKARLLLKEHPNLDIHFIDQNGLTSLQRAAGTPPDYRDAKDEIVALFLQHPSIHRGKIDAQVLIQLYRNFQQVTLAVVLAEQTSGSPGLPGGLDRNIHLLLAAVCAEKNYPETLVAPLLACTNLRINATIPLPYQLNSLLTKNLQYFRGSTCLHIACHKKHVTLVNQILKHSNIDVNIVNRFEDTPLHLACHATTDYYKEKAQQVVNLLLEKGASINVVNHKNETPLWIACEKNCEEIVSTLLNQASINVNLPYNSTKPPLALACQNKFNVEVLTQFLAHPDIDITRLGTEELYWLYKQCPAQVTTLLIDYAERYQQATANHYYINDLLIMACTAGHTDRVGLLLTRNDININTRNQDDETALKIVCDYKNDEIIELLLPYYQCSDIGVMDQNSLTAFYQYAPERASHYLLERSKYIPEDASKYHTQLLCMALQQGHSHMAAWLLIKKAIDINQIHQKGQTALHIAAKNGALLILFSTLLKQPRVDVNIRDEYGNTPLAIACTEGHSHIAATLLRDARTNPNTINNVGKTPLSLAKANKLNSLAYLFFKHPQIDISNLDKYWCKQLYNAKPKVIKRHLQSQQWPSIGDSLSHLLVLACEKVDEELLRLLLDYPGIDLNIIDSDLPWNLYGKQEHNYEDNELIQRILQHNAVTAIDKQHWFCEKWQPLTEIACKKGDTKMLVSLLRHPDNPLDHEMVIIYFDQALQDGYKKPIIQTFLDHIDPKSLKQAKTEAGCKRLLQKAYRKGYRSGIPNLLLQHPNFPIDEGTWLASLHGPHLAITIDPKDQDIFHAFLELSNETLAFYLPKQSPYYLLQLHTKCHCGQHDTHQLLLKANKDNRYKDSRDFHIICQEKDVPLIKILLNNLCLSTARYRSIYSEHSILLHRVNVDQPRQQMKYQLFTYQNEKNPFDCDLMKCKKAKRIKKEPKVIRLSICDNSYRFDTNTLDLYSALGNDNISVVQDLLQHPANDGVEEVIKDIYLTIYKADDKTRNAIKAQLDPAMQSIFRHLQIHSLNISHWLLDEERFLAFAGKPSLTLLFHNLAKKNAEWLLDYPNLSIQQNNQCCFLTCDVACNCGYHKQIQFLVNALHHAAKVAPVICIIGEKHDVPILKWLLNRKNKAYPHMPSSEYFGHICHHYGDMHTTALLQFRKRPQHQVNRYSRYKGKHSPCSLHKKLTGKSKIVGMLVNSRENNGPDIEEFTLLDLLVHKKIPDLYRSHAALWKKISKKLIPFFLRHLSFTLPKDKNGDTPLHILCKKRITNSVIKTIISFLNNGAGLNCYNQAKQTPWMLAHSQGFFIFTKFFEKYAHEQVNGYFQAHKPVIDRQEFEVRFPVAITRMIGAMLIADDLMPDKKPLACAGK